MVSVQDFDEIRLPSGPAKPPDKVIIIQQENITPEQVNQYGDDPNDWHVAPDALPEECTKNLENWWKSYIENYIPGGAEQQKAIAEVQKQPLPPDASTANIDEIYIIGFTAFIVTITLLTILKIIYVKTGGFKR